MHADMFDRFASRRAGRIQASELRFKRDLTKAQLFQNTRLPRSI